MELVPDIVLEKSAIVANCRMNREPNLHGNNGYEVELRFDPIKYLRKASRTKPVRWLDLCCGSANALEEASAIVARENLPVKIVGVDLVGMFQAKANDHLELIQASLNDWEPDQRFQLITCVHGMHYLGDKLGMLSCFRSWLNKDGQFIANLDMDNIKVDKFKTSRVVANWLRKNNCDVVTDHKLVQFHFGKLDNTIFKYLGANDQAGPNYTGQPAVDSYYRRINRG